MSHVAISSHVVMSRNIGGRDTEMPTPTVSHETWERTRALAQIALGTFEVEAKTLSFDTQVETICKQHEEGVDEGGEVDPVDVYLEDWPHGVTVPYDPAGHDRPHRPKIGQSTIDLLNHNVKMMKSAVPVDDTTFEQKLKLVLDSFLALCEKGGGTIERETS